MATSAVTRRFDLTDEQWAALSPLLPVGKKAGRPPRWTKRQLIDGIRWRVRTGAPWRDVPECYGSWQAAHAPFRRWQMSGAWQQVVTLAAVISSGSSRGLGAATVAGVDEEYAPRLSYELEGISTRSEFLRAAAESVGALIPAEQISWLAVDVPAGETEIHGTGGIDRPEIVQALARFVDGHPIWMSYRDQPGYISPIRMSDLIAVRAWRSHPVYSEVFRPLGGGVYQIGVAITPYRAGTGTGWGFSRTGRDFTDDELVTAARLQPVLMALNHASLRAFGPSALVLGTAVTARDETVAKAGLTRREAQVLELLAAGLTATAIGHVCRISPATVRKHLEHIYAKLGCSDRLLAVERARHLGLLPPGVRPELV